MCNQKRPTQCEKVGQTLNSPVNIQNERSLIMLSKLLKIIQRKNESVRELHRHKLEAGIGRVLIAYSFSFLSH